MAILSFALKQLLDTSITVFSETRFLVFGQHYCAFLYDLVQVLGILNDNKQPIKQKALHCMAITGAQRGISCGSACSNVR